MSLPDEGCAEAVLVIEDAVVVAPDQNGNETEITMGTRVLKVLVFPDQDWNEIEIKMGTCVLKVENKTYTYGKKNVVPDWHHLLEPTNATVRCFRCHPTMTVFIYHDNKEVRRERLHLEPPKTVRWEDPLTQELIFGGEPPEEPDAKRQKVDGSETEEDV